MIQKNNKDKIYKFSDVEANQMFEQISDIETAENKATRENEDLIDEMIKAGVYLGHKKSYWHPKMKSYILGVKNGVCIIDLNITIKRLREAAEFMIQVLKDGLILFVGTKINQNDLIRKIAEEFDCPYVSERWLGGTLTNFKVILKRIKYFINFEEKMISGEFDKYTKLEKNKMNKELEVLRKKFDGLRKLSKLPAALFIIDSKKEISAVREAKKMKIPIISLCNTNNDPSEIDYVIPCNNDSRSSVEFLIDYLIKEIKSVKK